MSLLKQLLVSVTLAILVILAGSLMLSVDSARQYLQGQLVSESENAAAALALSLSQSDNQDKAAYELLVMALFDSGQFRSVRLLTPDGQVLFERVAPRAEDESAGAPAWFVRQFSWSRIMAARDVSDGWKQVGSIQVEVDDRYALTALWKSSLRQLVLVLGAGLAWSLFVALLLGWFRRILRDEIADQVKSIGTDTASSATSGRTRLKELTPLIRVIKDTSERVRERAQVQTARIESLELEVNLDPITQLPNRKYFMNELKRAMSAGNEGGRGAAAFGHVLLFRQRDLRAVNTALTRSGADDWLRSIGQRIAGLLAENHEAGLLGARLNGSDFAVLMPGLSGPQATRLVQKLRNAMMSMRVSIASNEWCRWAFALVDYGDGLPAEGVMSRLDNALMRAESMDHGDVEYVTVQDDAASLAVNGETGWRGLLVDALSRNRFALSMQPVRYGGNRSDVAYTSASLVIRDGSHDDLSAYLFVPAAIRLGLIANCNVKAIELGLRWLTDNEGDLVVKVSTASLSQADFLNGLRQQLHGPLATLERCARLILEIDAQSLVACLEDAVAFGGLAAQYGVRVGVRRMAQHPGALVHMHRMALDYIKLNGGFMDTLSDGPGSGKLLSAIADAAHGLGVRVLMKGAPGADWHVRILSYDGCFLQVQGE